MRSSTYNNFITLLSLLITIFVQNAIANKIQSLQIYGYYNAQMHNTRKFETVSPDSKSDLIIRRGENVYLAVVLAEPFDSSFSQLFLRVMYGASPNQQDGSMFIMPVEQGPSNNNGSWAVHSASPKNKQVDFKLFVGNNAAVGGYRINFVIVENNQIVSEVTVPNSIYVLFNPWSRADTVFMPDKTDLDEYVLNTFGVIYVGTVYDPEAREWYYDQFKKSAIQTAVYLLDASNLSMKQRSNPIIVARTLSKMSNSNDDNGVVFGKVSSFIFIVINYLINSLIAIKWQEPYRNDGKAPWDWLSSGEVLDKFVQSGGTPVKYGQCWVFAGITTTLAR